MKIKKILAACNREVKKEYPFIEVFDLMLSEEVTNKILLPQSFTSPDPA